MRAIVRNYTKTGTGRGGSGGAQDGGVQTNVIDRASHFVCFESPQRTAAEIADWLAKEMMRWEVEKKFWATLDTGKSRNDMKELSERWIEMAQRGAAIPRPRTKDVAKL